MTEHTCSHSKPADFGGMTHMLFCGLAQGHNGQHRAMTHGGGLIEWPNDNTCGAPEPSGGASCILPKLHASPHSNNETLWLQGTRTVITEREYGKNQSDLATFNQMSLQQEYSQYAESLVRRVKQGPFAPQPEVRTEAQVARTYAERKKRKKK